MYNLYCPLYSLQSHFPYFSDAIMSEGRPLRYPYTTGAMLMQFPYKFHYKNAWVYR